MADLNKKSKILDEAQLNKIKWSLSRIYTDLLKVKRSEYLDDTIEEVLKVGAGLGVEVELIQGFLD
jgi:hypothetical protein